jgi:hypothetical protein
METKNDIIQRNENAPPTGSFLEREFVKRSSALNSMDQYAEQIAIDFFTWALSQRSNLSGKELFVAYKIERNLTNG